jgi:hypothetical protein
MPRLCVATFGSGLESGPTAQMESCDSRRFLLEAAQTQAVKALAMPEREPVTVCRLTPHVNHKDGNGDVLIKNVVKF